MKKLFAAIIIAIPFVAGSAYAQDKAPTAQQSKMGACNKDAKGMKGDERKTFMKDCLKKESDGRKAQNEKMKSCNKDAKGKKGPERKTFMKECLSK